MRILTTSLLLGSLVLNAALAYRLLSPEDRPEAPVTASPKPEPARPPVSAEMWRNLSTADPRTVHERLLAAGFPPEVARATVAALLQRDLDARREALLAGQGNVGFWKDPSQDAALQAELRRLNREGRSRVREILGPDEPTGLAAALSGQVSFLPPAKAEQVRELLLGFIDRSFDAAGDQVKQRAIEEERRAALRQLLTPDELTEYDLRNSNTAHRLRGELTAFRTTEEEFRLIHALRQPFDEKYSQTTSGIISYNTETGRQRLEDERRLTEQIKSALGPVRGAEYERALDPNYRTTSQLVSRLELPPETTDQLLALQREFEAQRRQLARTGPSREDLLLQATRLQQEALERVTPLLGGSRNVDAYRQYGGAWISNLAPRPSAMPTRPPAPK